MVGVLELHVLSLSESYMADPEAEGVGLGKHQRREESPQ